MTNYIEESLVFIGASVLFVPIFQRLGFGSVLGYLIAGVLVGPQALKLIHDSESVAHLSELGVVFLLFIIGLEIQPHKLWSMRKHLLGLGGLQILICTTVFATVGMMVGISPVASAVIGFSLSLSSTAFAMQTLMEKNLLNTEFGRASFAILLMQDLMAIPALAIIPALATTAEKTDSPPTAWLGLVIILALVVVSRYLIRPAFRAIASTRSREIFTAVTLFIVLGVAALMQKVGLSAALGTFIAGVLLADSEYRHELEVNLEPFKGLLMGLFFIAVGMGVSLDLIAQKPILIFSTAIAYLLGKAALIYGVGRFFKMNHSNSKLMALNISQGGEFAFVIFGIVTQMSLAPSETMSILTAIITISMALSPLLNMADEKLSEKIRKQQEPEYDEIKGETPKVIIAGFGRFGQIFGRIMRAQDIPFVAIDVDADQIDLVRKFGSKVYYGDASRKDLLDSAGAANAKYFILAIDDVEMSLRTAETVRTNYPHLIVFARARNRGHVFDLLALGVQNIKRETFDSSLYFVRDLLAEMGLQKDKATRLIERFRDHDEIMIKKQFSVRGDEKSFLSVSQQGVAQLQQVLNDDTLQSNIAP